VPVTAYEILTDPDDYVDFWDLEKVEGVTAARISELAGKLNKKAGEVLLVPLRKRGKKEW
jgi:hypothetical protein